MTPDRAATAADAQGRMRKAEQFADAASLLRVKTKAGYSAGPVSANDVGVAQRAHVALLELARSAGG
ncbi:hypothetical protein BKD30_01095 [Tersicoccus phoenicis]|uniref:Uncharacterized protein n=1 Tax=Tersicoccus phoenicis TaxID=554083 RepID=A0A1R1LPB2_9MICC|nr:hypothetical protein [Tersicoccus phoenicis]OMH29314.1 hypothetical protein BKD30_01095 [Tersicoccus phoenicis]